MSVMSDGTWERMNRSDSCGAAVGMGRDGKGLLTDIERHVT